MEQSVHGTNKGQKKSQKSDSGWSSLHVRSKSDVQLLKKRKEKQGGWLYADGIYFSNNYTNVK